VLTGTPAYAFPVLLILLSLPLYNVAGVLSYVLQGLADIRSLTIANVATAAASLIVLVPATIAFKLVGATAAVTVASILQFSFFGGPSRTGAGPCRACISRAGHPDPFSSTAECCSSLG
jgi:O-antigen/teichoic acid export membrane protein